MKILHNSKDKIIAVHKDKPFVFRISDCIYGTPNTVVGYYIDDDYNLQNVLKESLLCKLLIDEVMNKAFHNE